MPFMLLNPNSSKPKHTPGSINLGGESKKIDAMLQDKSKATRALYMGILTATVYQQEAAATLL